MVTSAKATGMNFIISKFWTDNFLLWCVLKFERQVDLARKSQRIESLFKSSSLIETALEMETDLMKNSFFMIN